MEFKETERIAICRVLLDIMADMGVDFSITDSRHYQSLKEKSGLTEQDFEAARSVSVLVSIVTLKNIHYNMKMLLALTVCDIYSECINISFNRRVTFETLMNAIEWPISFSEIQTISRTE